VTAAVVLAGRRNRGPLRRVAPDVEWEALIPVAGSPMGAYVVAALRAVQGVERVVVVGPEALAAPGVVVAPPQEDLVAALAAGLRAAGEAADFLVAAADSPLLTAATVAELLAECRRRGLAFGYPIVGRVLCEQAFPGVRRTYVHLREGSFTGGNCLYVRRDAVPGFLRLAERVYRGRKRPLRLATLLGWRLVLGLVLGTASLAAAERAGTRLLGAKAGAVVLADPGIGVDVDKPEDLELVREALGAAARRRGGAWA
jgi:CTP:molybdopterin cytidylyltransferase MocA